MKYVLLLISLISPLTQNASALEMEPIEKYANDNDFTKNPGSFQFILMRCTALYLLVGGSLKGNISTQEVGEKLIISSDVFSQGAFRLSNLGNVSEIEYVKNQITRMAEAYKIRYLDARALTGNFSDDPIIKSDFSECKLVLDALNK